MKLWCRVWLRQKRKTESKCVVIHVVESWRRGPVRGRILRSAARAVGLSEEVAFGSMQLVYAEDRSPVERWVSLDTLRSVRLVLDYRVTRLYAGSFVVGGYSNVQTIESIVTKDISEKSRLKSEHWLAVCRGENGNEAAGRCSIDWNPDSGAATAATVAILVEAKRWAEAVELIEPRVVHNAFADATHRERAALLQSLRMACRFDEALKYSEEDEKMSSILSAEKYSFEAGTAAAARGNWCAAADAFWSSYSPALALVAADAYLRAGNFTSARACCDFAFCWYHPSDSLLQLLLIRSESQLDSDIMSFLFDCHHTLRQKDTRTKLNTLASAKRSVDIALAALHKLPCYNPDVDAELAHFSAIHARITLERDRLWAMAAHIRRTQAYGVDYFCRPQWSPAPNHKEEKPTAPVLPKEEATPFEVLGISHQATRSEIRSAYRNAVLATHPDKNSGPEAKAQFLAVQAAYQKLSVLLASTPILNE